MPCGINHSADERNSSSVECLRFSEHPTTGEKTTAVTQATALAQNTVSSVLVNHF